MTTDVTVAHNSPSSETKPSGITTEHSIAATEVNVDEILNKYVGENGLWQWGIALLIFLSSPSMTTLPVFVNAVPDHRCRVENSMEELFRHYNLSFDEAAAFVGPWKDEVPVTMMGCLRFVLDWSNKTLIENQLLNISGNSFVDRKSLLTEKCTHGYVYKSKQFQYPSTVVEEFNLVCDDKMLSPLGTSLFLVGMLFGFILGGYIGDKFGRRTGAIGFSFIEVLAAVGVSLAPNHHIYHLMRTIVGFSSTGKSVVLRILPMEITNAKYRSYFTSSNVLGVVFIHRSIMSGIAYLVPQWRLLNVLSMLPCLAGFAYYCLLPESPRWLLSQHRTEEAIKVLRTGCRINHIFKKHRTKLSQFDDLFKHMDKIDTHKSGPSIDREPLSFSQRVTNSLKSVKKNVYDKQLGKTLIICILIFMTQSLAFLGVTLYGKFINYNIYIVTFINALTAIPGPIIASTVYRCFKYRRLPLMSTYIISAILLFTGGIYTLVWKPLTDAVLNVCCNCALVMYSASMIMILIYCAELFPSGMRTSAAGISSGLGRIGGIISTFVNYTDFTFGHGTPILIYSGSAIFQAFLLYFLHDTSGENLLDHQVNSESTIDDHIQNTLKRNNYAINHRTLNKQMKSPSTTTRV